MILPPEIRKFIGDAVRISRARKLRVFKHGVMALANRIMTDHDAMTVEDQVRYGIRICLSREAKNEEVAELAKVFKSELKLFSRDAATVKELMEGSNRWKPAKGVNQAELAAWFSVANILLNLDETVTKG